MSVYCNETITSVLLILWNYCAVYCEVSNCTSDADYIFF